MSFLSVKALHIIFIVTWFAGLFYIGRLFIYQTEAHAKPEPDRSILIAQFKIMSRRLWYGITWPSAVVTLVFGLWLLFLTPEYLKQGWMHVKLTFVIGLYCYHFGCQKLYTLLQRDIVKYSSFQLRLWNEGATVFLFAIVFLVVLKSGLSLLWAFLLLIAFSSLLLVAISYFRKRASRVEAG